MRSWQLEKAMVLKIEQLVGRVSDQISWYAAFGGQTPQERATSLGRQDGRSVACMERPSYAPQWLVNCDQDDVGSHASLHCNKFLAATVVVESDD
jgi:hypothetical protein